MKKASWKSALPLKGIQVIGLLSLLRAKSYLSVIVWRMVTAQNTDDLQICEGTTSVKSFTNYHLFNLIGIGETYSVIWMASFSRGRTTARLSLRKGAGAELVCQ